MRADDVADVVDANRHRLAAGGLVTERGAVHWMDLGEPVGSRPAKWRPVGVTALMAVDKAELGRATGVVPLSLLREVDDGLRRVLAL